MKKTIACILWIGLALASEAELPWLVPGGVNNAGAVITNMAPGTATDHGATFGQVTATQAVLQASIDLKQDASTAATDAELALKQDAATAVQTTNGLPVSIVTTNGAAVLIKSADGKIDIKAPLLGINLEGLLTANDGINLNGTLLWNVAAPPGNGVGDRDYNDARYLNLTDTNSVSAEAVKIVDTNSVIAEAVTQSTNLVQVSLDVLENPYYTIAVIPDSQYDSQVADGDNLNDQAQWILDRVDSENIQLIMHVGDITQANAADEWGVATNAYNRLFSSGVPTIFTIGNHDYANLGPTPTRTDTLANTYFPASLYTNETHFYTAYEAGKMENAAYKVDVAGASYLILVLEYNPRAAVLTWAEGLLGAMPNQRLQTLILTHAYLDKYGDLLTEDNTPGAPAGEESGSRIEQLVSEYPNISAVFFGHTFLRGRVIQRLGGGEALVNALGFNYQDDQSKTAVALYRIYPGQNRCAVDYYDTRDGAVPDHLDAFSFKWVDRAVFPQSEPSGAMLTKGVLPHDMNAYWIPSELIGGVVPDYGGGVNDLAVSGSPTFASGAVTLTGTNALLCADTLSDTDTDKISLFIDFEDLSPTVTLTNSLSAMIYSNRNFGEARGFYLYKYYTDNSLRFTFKGPGTFAYVGDVVDDLPYRNRVVFSYDGATGWLWLNGVEVSDQVIDLTISSQLNDYTLGFRSGSSVQGSFKIHAASVFDRALTSEECRALSMGSEVRYLNRP